MISSIKTTIFIATVFFLTACKTIPTTPDDAPVTEPKQTSPGSTGSTTQNSSSQSSSNNEPEQNSGEQATSANASANLTSEEEAQQLDQQLDERFADFDRLLLREREFLNEKQKEQGEPQNSSGGAAGGGDLDGFEGLDDFGDIASDDSSAQEGKSSTQQTAGQNSYPSNNTKINTPPDLVNSKGDDVIARQLREAAQKEKDPVLREKLWDEYRKYKSGI
jgi:hypothetical protein